MALTGRYKAENRTIRKIIESVGASTMGIYFLHTILILIAQKFIMPWLGHPGFGKRLLLTSGAYLGSYILTMIFARVPRLNEIIKI